MYGYDADDHRQLSAVFGAEHLKNREIVILFNDMNLEHDWFLAVVKDKAGRMHLLDKFMADGEHAIKAFPFEPIMCHGVLERLETFSAATDHPQYQELHDELCEAMVEHIEIVRAQAALDKDVSPPLGRDDSAMQRFLDEVAIGTGQAT